MYACSYHYKHESKSKQSTVGTHVPMEAPTANSGASGSLVVMCLIRSVRSLMSEPTYVRGVYIHQDTHISTEHMVTHTYLAHTQLITVH